jgi:hypothetical protein
MSDTRRKHLQAVLVATLVAAIAWVVFARADEPAAPDTPAAPTPATAVQPTPPPTAAAPKHVVEPRPLELHAPRALVFKVVKGDPGLATNLPVVVQSACGPTIEARTTDAGVLELPGVGQCDLALVMGLADVGFELFDDDTVELTKGGDAQVHVVDEAGNPVAGAVVTGRSDENRSPEAPPLVPFGCTTDGSGRCRVRWPAGRGARLNVDAPGFARLMVLADFAPVIELALRAQRPLKVTLTSAEVRFAVPMVLWVASSFLVLNRTVSEPGVVTIDHVPLDVPLRVTLRHGYNWEKEVELDAGVEPIELTWAMPEPRRLEVWARFEPADEPYGVKARCGKRGQWEPFGSAGADGTRRAVFEYAPAGPCSLRVEGPGELQERFEPVTVTPPTTVTLTRAVSK